MTTTAQARPPWVKGSIARGAEAISVINRPPGDSVY